MKNKKIILITGASSGIGKVTALQLLNEGHTVYGAARRTDKMRGITNSGGHALSMDITNENQVKTAVDEIIADHGHIDVLVNNAGYAVYGAVEDVSLSDARHQFEVNIFGLAAITKAVLPHMREQRSGKIINISSVGGKIYTPLGAWYHASKHALEGWSDCLRWELRGFGIDVVIIEPGIIKTEFADVFYEPAIERSKNGVYKDVTYQLGQSGKALYEKPGSYSNPEEVARTISKAIAKHKPKTRYLVGKMAKPTVFIRKFISDRLFDKMLDGQF